jgi:hypothetical protein
MQIYVKDLYGTKLTCNVEATDTVDSLHNHLREKYPDQHPPYLLFSLVHRGKKLSQQSTIGEYNIQPEDTIQVIMNLKG